MERREYNAIVSLRGRLQAMDMCLIENWQRMRDSEQNVTTQVCLDAGVVYCRMLIKARPAYNDDGELYSALKEILDNA